MTRLFVALVLLAPASAIAQQQIEPSGWDTGAPAQPPPAPPPQPIIINTGQQPEGAAPPAEQGYYYTQDQGLTEPDQGLRWAGPIPESHVVRRGDTLWDICAYYFNNPWQWPKVWSYNKAITNPHWIYPGDLVRLYGPGEGGGDLQGGQTPPGGQAPPPGVQPAAEPPRPSSVEFRQLAFVGLNDLKIAGTVNGSVEEKSLLAQGDEIFVSYPSGKPPQVGSRYAIYTEKKSVSHPEKGGQVGSYVELLGEVQITEVKKGKTARGTITYSNNIIERGNRVGTTKTQFKQVPPVPADRDLEGVIVGSFTQDLIGADQVVFIDRGSADGVKPGNRFMVVRRGDAYDPNQASDWGAGKDDRRYPDQPVAQITVLEAAKNTSVCAVNYSNREAEVGDHVVMRKGK
jgi:hypothetical protein